VYIYTVKQNELTRTSMAAACVDCSVCIFVALTNAIIAVRLLHAAAQLDRCAALGPAVSREHCTVADSLCAVACCDDTWVPHHTNTVHQNEQLRLDLALAMLRCPYLERNVHGLKVSLIAPLLHS
jgi:hypothetical protein